MSTLLHRDPRTILPDLVDWFEEPFVTLRPYLAQPIRVEELVEGDRYVVRAEIAGVDPEKDVEVTVGSGYLTIRAVRSDMTEGKHRSEFRYGAFSRSLPLPTAADEDAVTASYRDGILTVTIGMVTEKKDPRCPRGLGDAAFRRARRAGGRAAAAGWPATGSPRPRGSGG